MNTFVGILIMFEPIWWCLLALAITGSIVLIVQYIAMGEKGSTEQQWKELNKKSKYMGIGTFLLITWSVFVINFPKTYPEGAKYLDCPPSICKVTAEKP